MVCLPGIEPGTYSVGGCHSIQLRYRHSFYTALRFRGKSRRVRNRVTLQTITLYPHGNVLSSKADLKAADKKFTPEKR